MGGKPRREPEFELFISFVHTAILLVAVQGKHEGEPHTRQEKCLYSETTLLILTIVFQHPTSVAPLIDGNILFTLDGTVGNRISVKCACFP